MLRAKNWSPGRCWWECKTVQSAAALNSIRQNSQRTGRCGNLASCFVNNRKAGTVFAQTSQLTDKLLKSRPAEWPALNMEVLCRMQEHGRALKSSKAEEAVCYTVWLDVHGASDEQVHTDRIEWREGDTEACGGGGQADGVSLGTHS